MKFNTIIVLVAILCLSIFVYAQDKKGAEFIKQQKILADIPFDRVVLYTLIAFEQAYKVKASLAPQVHQDDYYTYILNTAKRLALGDHAKKNALPVPAAADTTKKK